MGRMLVTGGAGFIGTNLTNELRSRGHDVWTIDVKPNSDPQHHRADVAFYQQLNAFMTHHEFDYVYHLAAEYGRWNGEDHYDNLWRVNVIGLKNMLRLQEIHRFRMISFSSAEVYGDYDGTMSEAIMDKIPIKQMNDYAISKWAGELQCINHANMFGVEIVRVRPVNCYGPHEYYDRYRGVIPVFVHNCLKGEPFTVHRGHKRIFDYVDDTVRTVANIADGFIPGEVYNVGSNEQWEISIEELAQVVIEETGAAPSLAQLDSAESFTTRVKKMDFSKSRRDLDHKAVVNIRDGVRRYVTWMKAFYDFKEASGR